MNDQQLAELREKEKQLNKVCNEIEATKRSALSEWSVAYNAIQDEEKRRKLRAEILKEIEAERDEPVIYERGELAPCDSRDEHDKTL
jgi:hypothetical protein